MPEYNFRFDWNKISTLGKVRILVEQVVGSPSQAQISQAVADYIDSHPGALSPLSQATKSALLDCFANVAWKDVDGDDYYDALDAVLNAKALLSITAVYTQSGTVYDTDSLDSLKADLVVTANYDDGTTADVTSAAVLSGTLAVGTSTITATYQEKTATFDVTVTHDEGKSDMDGWTDGVAYTDLEIVQNEYVDRTDGSFDPYVGWNRTGYVPINGASTLSIPKLSGTGGNTRYNAFYRQDHTWISSFDVSHGTGYLTVTVPSNAYYFVLSEKASDVAYWIENGIIPNA